MSDLEPPTDTPATPGQTTLGTPASPKWDAEWLTEVDRVETELGRRICGAHTPAWTPCKLGSTHPNGRCRFHGGHPGIGAPDGNRNAWIHGLYSRRLQQCGEHCPLWNHCPMAGKDVLDLKPSERPHCVYEQEEYEATLSTFSLEKGPAGRLDGAPNEIGVARKSDPSNMSESSDAVLRASLPPREPMGLVERNVALFQVMLTRAQSALGIARLTDDTRARTLNYQMHATRIGALVQAQLHIARELRQWLKLLPGFDPRRGPARGPKGSDTPKPPEPEGYPMRMMKLLQDEDVIAGIRAGFGMAPDEHSPFIPDLPKRHRPPDATPQPA